MGFDACLCVVPILQTWLGLPVGPSAIQIGEGSCDRIIYRRNYHRIVSCCALISKYTKRSKPRPPCSGPAEASSSQPQLILFAIDSLRYMVLGPCSQPSPRSDTQIPIYIHFLLTHKYTIYTLVLPIFSSLNPQP